jgi:serine/threonine protein kinase
MNDFEEIIDDLLVDWELARQEGRQLSIESLCSERPDLKDEVARRINVLQEMSWVADLSDATAASSMVSECSEDTDIHDTDMSVREFVDALQVTGLLDESQMVQVMHAMPSEVDALANSLAERLVAEDLLTKYQANMILGRSASPLVLDRYVILDSIGAGGMGIVYKAMHRSLHQIVALKLLPLHAVDSPDKVRRFQREMRAAAKISHPNVVRAFDASEANGQHFFAMEYVEGRDLRSFVKRDGPLSVERAVHVISEAAAGLGSAHSEGIVHRDVKPANILLGNDGAVKVLDLGLARTQELAQESTTNELTRVGMTMGTITYMSPEQALDAHQADAQSDIYSLGCTLHYLLQGRPLFEESNSVQMLVAHRETPPPDLTKDRDDVPASLDRLFKRMVAKSPKNRPANMEEIQAELTTCGPFSPVNVPRDDLNRRADQTNQPNAKGSRKPAWIWGVAGGAVVLLAFLLGNLTGWFDQKKHNEQPGDAPQNDTINKLAGNRSQDDKRADFRRIVKQMLRDSSVSLEVEAFGEELLVEFSNEVPDEPFTVIGALLWTEDRDGLQKLDVFPDLRRLTITGAELASEPEIQLNGIQKLKRLSELILDGCRLHPSVLPQISEIQSLRDLEIGDCIVGGDLKVLASLTELTHLSFRQMRLSTTANEDSLEWIGRLKKLTYLDLGNTDADGQVLQHLDKLPDLKSLYLTDLTLGTGIQNLSTLTHLQVLDLEGTDLTDDGAKWIASLSSLRFLDVGNTKLSAAGVRTLTSVSSLEALVLNKLRVQDAIEQISELPNLEILDASNTDLNNQGLERLADHKGLLMLGVGNTDVTQSAIGRFERQSPSCKVVRKARGMQIEPSLDFLK